MEEEIEPPIFVEDVSLDSDSSSEFGWSDESSLEPIVQCSPLVDPSLCDDSGEKFLIVEETNVEVDFLFSAA
ncbi:hypothetical protein RHMOL_Rhmol01G0186200 [Rhododendron molle]|uniref:Uncharacterized protein n=1 Tax=Rhododendron molle TaxID=49168 RepID=A0ACC0Q4V5_RHOML|nr:hypothetical protein RHMOL_Rhmol01G0186200 [Rhododendron molle]